MHWIRTHLHLFNEFRTSHTVKAERFRHVLLYIFPVFIVLIAEFNHTQTLSSLVDLMFVKPNIFLFDLILEGLLYFSLLLILRRAWIAMAINGFLLYLVSMLDFFKFRISGSHFVLADLKMAGNVGELTQFAKITITFPLILNALLIIAYVALTACMNARLYTRFRRSMIAGILSMALCITCILVPPISNSIYDFFDINREESVDVFCDNVKFNDNSLFAYLAQTMTEQVEKIVHEPDGYSKKEVSSLLSPGTDESTDEKPNVIIIMSESYTDFRKFRQLDVDEEVYRNFDRLSEEGMSGTAIVPTFGGGTVRSEFELLFGLPVKSLNNASIPHSLLAERSLQPTFASMFRSLGYATSYIHPFKRDFYGREDKYASYGFDSLLFEDNMTVDLTPYRLYPDDSTVYAQVLEQIEESESPDYIFCTTMQNHQPYMDENSSLSEFSYYLQGIQHTDEQLGAFTDALRELDEPTILLFVGDHMPAFSTESTLYDDVGINDQNSSVLYVQKYFIWANYDVDFSAYDGKQYSLFYLPHIMMQLSGQSQPSFVSSALAYMNECPIYSMSVDGARSSFWDVLTYDRVLGENYSTP